MNEELRKRVKVLRALNNYTYKEIASYLEITVPSMYSWVEGNYDLSHEKQVRLRDIISNLEV